MLFMANQGLNPQHLVEKGLVVEVERGEDGWFQGSDIAKALNKVMVGKESESLRVRATLMCVFFEDVKLHQETTALGASFGICNSNNKSKSTQRL
uniref:Uncharacterized protein n=1 Tax=Nelumbo nucifera TaxID=4432 RepID=A0A822YJR7_NELNU|nr:TPA_asm: hypothetical protein HUJ06_031076 [Nelumbo nucifera]